MKFYLKRVDRERERGKGGGVERGRKREGGRGRELKLTLYYHVHVLCCNCWPIAYIVFCHKVKRWKIRNLILINKSTKSIILIA